MTAGCTHLGLGVPLSHSCVGGFFSLWNLAFLTVSFKHFASVNFAPLIMDASIISMFSCSPHPPEC